MRGGHADNTGNEHQSQIILMYMRVASVRTG